MEKLCNLGHENLIKIYEHDMLQPNHAVYFIDMELCEINLDEYIHGHLTDIHGLLNWDQVVCEGQESFLIYTIMQQILLGLIFIHGHDEVHHDLTPQNNKLTSFPAYLQSCTQRLMVSGK